MSRPLITIENWASYRDNMTDCGYAEYIFASESFVLELDRILKAGTTFEKLKEQLEDFRNERLQFIEYADEHSAQGPQL